MHDRFAVARLPHSPSRSPLAIAGMITTRSGMFPAVAAADPFPAPVTGVTHYTLGINQFRDTVHPTLGPTTFWGYDPAMPLGGGGQAQKHLGGTIVAQKGVPIQLTFNNNLPPTHIIP